MFSPFIVLLSFSKSLATECLFLNDEQSIVRPTLIDINPHELKYYPFMISLNKCAVSCNVLSLKICVPRETKTINVKAFDMITNKDEAKAITKHVSCNFKCKSIVQHVNQNKNGIIKHVNMNLKIIISVKKIISHVLVRILSI